MTIDEFRAAAIALLRSEVGWQSAIARQLHIAPRTVRRWLHDTDIPDWVEARLAELMDSTAPNTAWPRDEWIIGEGIDRRREYIVHTASPRFIARVVECEVDGLPIQEQQPADAVSGITLCEIVWIDQPQLGAVTALLEAACNALEDNNAAYHHPAALRKNIVGKSQ